MLKILSVFGTRPEAIKMAPLIQEIGRTPGLKSLVCVTAQHREMLDQALAVFGVTPDYDMDLMRPAQTLADITSGVLTGLGPILAETSPDLVLVHGDTTTSFAAALAAYYAKIPVGHVEAGLRSHNRYSPFPEEINRVLCDRLSLLHFCPTESNAENLRAEGTEGLVTVTGNTVIDALHMLVRADYSFHSPTLAAFDFSAGRTILLTAHRRENFGAPFEQIFRAVLRLTEAYPDLRFIYPVHRNPAVTKPAYRVLGNRARITLIDPVEADDLHNLMGRCYMVLTDSGGLQEEAPALGKPVLVLRTETERPEAVEMGAVKVVGVEEADIFREASVLLDDSAAYRRMSLAVNPYGDGKASKRICQAISAYFGI
ncbi:MAG: UDP-N-acetylglucosamine 2-epimerase (non-hydrolyzing) [Firmicutes bacterium]|nr:UDP-N-acetylglucosamine 2-epimerase (non-hydrolyzing) [Bacillota bacterium]